jgi:hypothetical protein
MAGRRRDSKNARLDSLQALRAARQSGSSRLKQVDVSLVSMFISLWGKTPGFFL